MNGPRSLMQVPPPQRLTAIALLGVLATPLGPHAIPGEGRWVAGPEAGRLVAAAIAPAATPGVPVEDEARSMRTSYAGPDAVSPAAPEHPPAGRTVFCAPAPKESCYVHWSTLEGQTTPYTIPIPKKPNPNQMLPRRWPAPPAGPNQVLYEVNLNPCHLPTQTPALPPAGSGCSAWPNPVTTQGGRIDAYLYWVSACAQAWNENPTSDIDLRLVQPAGLLPDDFPCYDATPSSPSTQASFGADQIWSVTNGGPTGNGRNEIIAVDQFTGSCAAVAGCTSMLYDPATGDILEVDIIILKAVADNLITQAPGGGSSPGSTLTHEFGHMLGLDHSDMARPSTMGNAPAWSSAPFSIDPSRMMPLPQGPSLTPPPVASDATFGARSNPGYMGTYADLPPLQIPLWPDDAAGLASLYPITGQLWAAPVSRANCLAPDQPTQAAVHKTSLINVSGRMEGAVMFDSAPVFLWGAHVVAIDAATFDLGTTGQGPGILGKLSGHDRLSPTSVIGGFDERDGRMTSGEYILDGLPAESLPVPVPGWTFTSSPRDYHLVVEPLSWTLGHNPSGAHFAEEIVDPVLNPGVPPNLRYPAGFKTARNLLLDDYWTTSGVRNYVFDPVFLYSTAPQASQGCPLQQTSPFPSLRIHPGSIIRLDVQVPGSTFGNGPPSDPFPPNAVALPVTPDRNRPGIAMVETSSGSRIPAAQSSYAVPASFTITIQSNVDLNACGYALSGTYRGATGQSVSMTFTPSTLPAYPPSGIYTFTTTPPPGAALPLTARVTLTDGTVTVHNEIIW